MIRIAITLLVRCALAGIWCFGSAITFTPRFRLAFTAVALGIAASFWRWSTARLVAICFRARAAFTTITTLCFRRGRALTAWLVGRAFTARC